MNLDLEHYMTVRASLRAVSRCTALALAAGAVLGGCGAWQAVSDTSTSSFRAVFYKQVKVLNVDLVARASVNPDEGQRPCSVAVRVYQLGDRRAFDAASYDDLLRNDRTILAQDLQDTVAAVVNPGASASLSQPMKDGTRYVAVVAFYRDPPQDGAWRRVIAKNKLDADKPFTLELIDNRLVTPAEAAPATDASK